MTEEKFAGSWREDRKHSEWLSGAAKRKVTVQIRGMEVLNKYGEKEVKQFHRLIWSGGSMNLVGRFLNQDYRRVELYFRDIRSDGRGIDETLKEVRKGEESETRTEEAEEASFMKDIVGGCTDYCKKKPVSVNT